MKKRPLLCKNAVFQRLLGYDSSEVSLMGELGEELTVYMSVMDTIFRHHTSKMPAIFDRKYGILHLSKEAAEFLGLEGMVENMPGKLIENGFIAKESVSAYRECFRMDYEEECASALLKIFMETDKVSWVRLRSSILPLWEEVGRYILFTIEDWTARHEAEVEQEKWKFFYYSQREEDVTNYRYNISKDVLEYVNGDNKAMATDNGRCLRLSEMVRDVAEKIVYIEDREDYLNVFNREHFFICYEKNQHVINQEHRRMRKDGTIYWADSTVQLIEDPYSKELLAFVSVLDIDEKKKTELELQKRSVIDDLTGIMNRGAAVREITKLLSESKEKKKHAFVMMDIDYFKQLNDTLGHMTGDQVLEQVAATLKKSQRADDIIGRMGGDEFVLCLKNISDETILSKRMQDLCEGIARRIQGEIEITASVGVSIYPRDGCSFASLYEKADIALYKAKTRGRNCFVIYEP